MISVIVVTYNRKLLAKECLNSILSQEPNTEFEVIIFDNCSCDGTEEIFKGLVHPRLKFIRNNSRVSLSTCKNLVVQASRGDIIAFIDDDCLASKNWLKDIDNYLQDYDFVGGAVLPNPTAKFPWWWQNSLNWLIGINPEPNRKFLPLGSNLAFKKNVLDKMSEINQIKPTGTYQYLPYREDYYRVKKALDSGFSMGINKDMIVYHDIPKARFTIAYLLKRSYNEGCAWLNYERCFKNFIFSFFILPVHFVRLLISLDINYFFRMITSISYIINYIENVRRY